MMSLPKVRITKHANSVKGAPRFRVIAMNGRHMVAVLPASGEKFSHDTFTHRVRPGLMLWLGGHFFYARLFGSEE